MKIVVSLVVVLGALSGCQKSALEPTEDTAALHDQFHGQYRLVSATAETAVDLNRDGQASTDLKKEIPDLALSAGQLNLLVKDNGLKMFEHYWPQPNVTRDWRQSSPDSLLVLGYSNQTTPRYFTFDKSVTHLLVESGLAADERFPTPEVVTIESNEQIQVVVNRLLFTRQGWRLVRITTWYKRYTIVT